MSDSSFAYNYFTLKLCVLVSKLLNYELLQSTYMYIHVAVQTPLLESHKYAQLNMSCYVHLQLQQNAKHFIES